MKRRYLLIGIAFLLIAAVLFVRIGDIQATQAAAPAPICLEALQEPTITDMFLPYQLSPCQGSQAESPFYEDWLYSPHNDSTARLFALGLTLVSFAPVATSVIPRTVSGTTLGQMARRRTQVM